jgi:hypothetical protein
MARKRYYKKDKCILKEMVKLAEEGHPIKTPRGLKSLIRTAKANCSRKARA